MIGALDRQTRLAVLTVAVCAALDGGASRRVMAARLAGLMIAVCAAVALTVVSPAHAASARDPKFQPNLEATVSYLEKVQQEDGGFAEPGTEPESDFTAWVSLALAAAGINPRDQTTAPQHWVGGHSSYTFLAELAHNASLTTDFERELLVVDAAGTSPHDFGGVDLAGEILKRQIASGIKAGEEILQKYRSHVERQIRLPLRVWRMGLLQLMAGCLAVWGIMWILTDMFPALDRLLGGF